MMLTKGPWTRSSAGLLAAATAAAFALGLQAGQPFIEADVPVLSNRAEHFYRLPSLLVTSQGTVLAAGQKRLGRRDDFAPSNWMLRRSCDGGRTFAPEQTLFERSGYCTFNGNLVEDRQTGTLFACFIAFPQAEHASWFTKTWIPQGGGFSIVKSTDDGRTWSAPILAIPKPNAEGWRGGGAFNNNHGVQLRSGPHAGRLVIGARAFKTGVYENRAKGGLIYSDDHGETWHVGGVPFPDLGDVNGEMTVGETADGEVYVNCRNGVSKILGQAQQAGQDIGQGPSPQRSPWSTGARELSASQGVKLPKDLVLQRRLYARSRDGGETFYEEGCHADLFDGPCNAGQTAYPRGDDEHGVLLFTAPANRQRTRLTGYISSDGGRTWMAGNVISEHSGGYSDVAVLSDRTILTMYESQQGLLLGRFNLDWLLGKNNVNSVRTEVWVDQP
jgi:sialidase-1